MNPRSGTQDERTPANDWDDFSCLGKKTEQATFSATAFSALEPVGI